MSEALEEVQEEVQEEIQEEEQNVQNENEEQKDNEDVPEQNEEKEDEEERKRVAREKYQERQRQKQEQTRQEELQVKQDKGIATKEEISENEDLKRRLREMEDIVGRQVHQDRIKQAEKELTQIEVHAKKDKDFVSAYPDYEEKVSNAIEFAKLRLMQQGMSEDEASEQVRYEKTMLADRAVASGKDPLDAIYTEAEQINTAFEQFAERLGYKKGTPKTNLQAQREASRPNAVSGGTGRGANAITRKFDELGDDDLKEIQEASIWDIE